ncbi:Aspartate/tyrosine/aromatic aminotransferase [Hoeflea phototrophica DFL-43]|uniref:aspartate transaminase n=2 Tax=Hoeflea TaxID=274591 RepID=A9D583_HOEPD|nr:Aspartate/tyrosine/aromatic aminotransferase [Hoeflea phototrophica DFL-43]
MTLTRKPSVEPFHAMDVLAEATRLKAQGRDVISMAVGQPAHPAPRAARQAAARALEHGRLGYTDALGIQSLKQAIAARYARSYGVDVDPSRVAVTTGSSAGFNLAFLQLFNPGDVVAITRPGYPAYRNILSALGLKVLEIPVGPETGHALTPEAIERAEAEAGDRAAGVLIASPANPTGAVHSRDAIARLDAWCADRSVAFISDEIYHGLTWSGEETTALSVSDNAVIINSFSKYFCMTGWRIGWMILPEDLIRPVECLAQSLYISAPELSQIAAEAALSATEEMDAVCRGYQRNRALLGKRLPELGLPFAAPMDGAFYAWVDVSAHTNDSMAFARQMLAEIHVAATPGRDFDPVDGARFMRFSYAGSHDEMETALDRIETWFAKR